MEMLYFAVFISTVAVNILQINGISIVTRQEDVGTPVDIVFVIDGSASVSNSDFIQQKNFIASIIYKLDIGKNNTNVGALVYSSTIGKSISLTPFKGKDLLLTLVHLMSKLNEGSDTAIGIKYARQMLNEQGRVNARKTMVVFADGRSRDPGLTVEEARLAKDVGIIIFAVGVGQNQPHEFEQEILDIASYPEMLIRSDDFASLQTAVTSITEVFNPSTHNKIVCQGNSDMINCPALTKIRVLYANYGRTSSDVCLNTSWNTYHTSCGAINSETIVKSWCEGQNQCYLFAVNELFGNPCIGTHKYLQVTYQCLFDPTAVTS